MTPLRWNLALSTLSLAVGATACQTTSPDLVPVDADEVTIQQDVAVAEDGDVQVAVEHDDWKGVARISEDVTPVRVSIENRSDESLSIRYGDFVLEGTSGATYRAIPPFEIDGAVMGKKYPRLDKPDILHSRFRIYRPYEIVYPRIDPFTGPYYHDPYYSEQPVHWPRKELPTDEMLQRALPEGVVDPGGRVGGYLYFQRVDDDEARVTLNAEIEGAESGETRATVEVPFLVRD